MSLENVEQMVQTCILLTVIIQAYDKTTCVGAIVCKIDVKETPRCTYTSEPIRPPFKGYIGMLDVKKEYRKLKIGTKLVTLAIDAMREMKVDEIVLETEVTNKPALRLYENLGFLKESRHFRYYLNGLDAFRLKLWLKEPEECST